MLMQGQNWRIYLTKRQKNWQQDWFFCSWPVWATRFRRKWGGCCFVYDIFYWFVLVFVWMFRLKSCTPYFCIYIYIIYKGYFNLFGFQTLSIRSNDCIQPLSRNANNYQRPPSCRCNIPIHVSRVHTARFNWSCSTLSIVSTRKSNKTQ